MMPILGAGIYSMLQSRYGTHTTASGRKDYEEDIPQ